MVTAASGFPVSSLRPGTIISDVIGQFRHARRIAEVSNRSIEIARTVGADPLPQFRHTIVGREDGAGGEYDQRDDTFSDKHLDHWPRIIVTEQTIVVVRQAAENLQVKIIDHRGRFRHETLQELLTRAIDGSLQCRVDVACGNALS